MCEMDYVLLCRRCAKELLAHFKHPLKHTTNASILLVYDPHTLNTSIHTCLHVANQLERCNTRSDLSPGASAGQQRLADDRCTLQTPSRPQDQCLKLSAIAPHTQKTSIHT